MSGSWTFTAPLWRWAAKQESADPGSWSFVTLPDEVADEAPAPKRKGTPAPEEPVVENAEPVAAQDPLTDPLPAASNGVAHSTAGDVSQGLPTRTPGDSPEINRDMPGLPGSDPSSDPLGVGAPAARSDAAKPITWRIGVRSQRALSARVPSMS